MMPTPPSNPPPLRPRVLYLANNWLGWKVLEYLARTADIAGVVLHPSHKRRFGEEILTASGVAPDRVFDGSTLRDPEVLERIAALRCDFAVSVLFDYIVKPAFIRLFSRGVLNLHPALLPYNRGQYPNVWSIVEGTPSGVTLHYIDEGVDTGDIVDQLEVPVEPIDTGETVYRKLERAGVDLFTRAWPSLLNGTASRSPQTGDASTSHRTADVEKIDRIDLDATFKARELIDILRARTFPPYRGAYFEHDGRRVYISVSLEYGNEVTDA